MLEERFFLQCDTPHGLKPNGFLDLRPSHLRRVQATTLARCIERVTILLDLWRQHLTHFAGCVAREDVCRADAISVPTEPASRAPIGTPCGFMPVAALRAGLTGVRFVD